ncbi:HET-domain-containing protein [Aspergillus welwitschiae]|uniref:HET-domain-containing protein n=1 Tax=Aspergillus welwitschiae TaxID=1341132 RepID=A0A3F3QF55_9EURO|nr:HET-domain-containing protein [Aspergillus welwitschiae]RDH37735.1 HET-domain-containing protein [Aspergillus welwitschiae]
MIAYTYSALPPGSFTRMIRLLPQRERNAPIECILINYDLSVSESRNHLYEALSYTWGSNDKPQAVLIGGSLLPVTENLHTALSYLRDHQLERTLWVDAICINQEDEDEKNTHIPLMRAIYAQADRVIVWLGEPDHAGPNALDTIHQLAENKVLLYAGTESVDLSEADHVACMRPLRHDWFRRIWVLQEVGVARSIMFRCGLAQVNGYSFCEGLSRLKLSLLPDHVLTVIPLVRSSIIRPRNSRKLPGNLPLGELIDMYRTHFATVPHDKIYALLGLCSDDLKTPCLRPNYRLAFSAVVKQIVNYIFMGNHTVAVLSDTNIAVIKGKGWILGHIVSVERSTPLHDYQTIGIGFHENALGMFFETQWGNKWVIHASATLIQVYDIVCFLHNAPKPTIIRLGKGKISVVVSMATPDMVKKKTGYESFRRHSKTKISDLRKQFQLIYAPPIDLFFTWDISPPARESRSELTSLKVPTSTTSSSLGQTLEGKEQEYGCLKLILEDIIVNILKSDDFEAQFEPMKRLLCQTQVQIPVSERVLEAAAARYDIAYKLLKILLDDQRKRVSIIEISVRNATSIYELMGILFLRTADSYITERVIDETSQNPQGNSIIKLFYQYQKSLPVSEQAVENAAKHTFGLDIILLFYYYHQNSLPISERAVQNAVEHIDGLDILRLFYQHQRCLPISGHAVQNAVEQIDGLDILRLFYQHQGNLPISELAVQNAVEHIDGLDILRLFYQHQKCLPISEHAVQNVVEHVEGLDILCLFYQHQDNLPISEHAVQNEAVETAVHYPDGIEILRLFYQHQHNLPISEEVIEAAVKYNDRLEILRLFYQHQDTLPFSEDLLNAVVQLPDGTELLQFLFKQQSCPPISASTIQNAILSPHALKKVHLLQQYYQERFPISEAVVTAVMNHTDGPNSVRQRYQQDKGLPISKETVSTAIMDSNCFENLNFLYKLQKSLPINKAAVEFIVMELLEPGDEGSRLRDLTGDNTEYEYRRKCLKLIYQHQSDVVLRAAKDSIVKDKIIHMLREFDEQENE